MINEWKQYLQQTGAHFDENNQVIHFGQPSPKNWMDGNFLVDLSPLRLIQISGNDALSFLQSQFTNDVRQVDSDHSQLNAWCNPKGRVIANFRLFQRQTTYYMVLPQESITTVLERLRKYVLRAVVNLAVSSDLLCIGMIGKQSIQALTDCLGCSLSAISTHLVFTQANITIICVSESQQRFLIVGEIAALQKLWECAKTILLPVKTSTWQLFDVLSGIPQIVPATSEAFVPQMINWQTLGGVNFKKGCYPGQEIVARMQYLATQKRQLFILKAANAMTVPRPGDIIYADSDHEIGSIVNAEFMPEGGYVALAVLPQELDVQTLQDAQGVVLQQYLA